MEYHLMLLFWNYVLVIIDDRVSMLFYNIHLISFSVYHIFFVHIPLVNDDPVLHST